MLDAIGSFLPAAAGVALSPFPIAAVVIVLGTPRATANGLGFGLGWVVGLSSATAIVVLLAGDTEDPTSDASTFVSWAKVLIGAALLLLAVQKWRTRPRRGEEPEVPGWMATLDGVEPPRAFAIGAVLGGANPKNLAFTFAAASSIAAAGLDGPQATFAAGLYVALASCTVLGALLAHLVARSRSEAALSTIKDFMLANNAVIMMVILLILGAKVLGDGLSGI